MKLPSLSSAVLEVLRPSLGFQKWERASNMEKGKYTLFEAREHGLERSADEPERDGSEIPQRS